jgi:two-component system, OmpR family, phosphate regulon sensor histidine kinase PhoR
VVSANAAARSLFELQHTAGLPGRDLAGVIRDPKVLEAADVALAQNRKTEAEFTLPSPVEHTFGALIVPLSATARDGTALIVALHDQTERLKMDRMRADFVANASHELRTPLASVLGFIETLRGPAKNDEKAREEFLEIMLKQANRMTRLIDDLLSLSRIELREHTRPTEPVDIAALLQNTTELLDRQIKERRAALVLNIAPRLPAVLADSNELSQVFHNLIINAVKYGGDQGRIEITAELSDQRPPAMPGRGTCLRVSVRDFGEGIAREHIPRLTERFYRVDTARSRELGDTGLGLAIVKHITNRHRGALVIDSDLGKGATFTVYLPIAASSSAS